jgi:hypothetical protein
MQKRSPEEIRTQYVEFFKSKGHTFVRFRVVFEVLYAIIWSGLRGSAAVPVKEFATACSVFFRSSLVGGDFSLGLPHAGSVLGHSHQRSDVAVHQQRHGPIVRGESLAVFPPRVFWLTSLAARTSFWVSLIPAIRG